MLANVALVLHDVHIDLTREKVFTPVEPGHGGGRPVAAARYGSPTSIAGRTRTAGACSDVLEVMGRRNSLLEVRTVDPDREPSLAQAYGLRMSNAAILEADGRKIVVQTHR